MNDGLRFELPAAALEVLIDQVTMRVLERLDAERVEHPPSPYMTIIEAAEYLRCSRQRIDDLLSRRLEVPPEWQLLTRFLALTGLRIGEALALRWSDLDLGSRRLRVARRVYDGKFAPPKSAYGRRAVPLTEALAQDLWQHRKGQRPDADDALVFPGRAGATVDPSAVFRAVRAAGKRAGTPWAGLHTLRHTCATMLFRHGLNAKQVQLWLGHHSPAFTLATYVHLLPDDLPSVAFLDALVSAQRSPTRSSSASRPESPLAACT